MMVKAFKRSYETLARFTCDLEGCNELEVYDNKG